MVNAKFAHEIGGAAQNTYLSTPLLPASMYPTSAQRVFEDYRRHFHEAPTPDALYGYEAMSVVLAAIRRAGAEGNQRPAVIRAFFQTHERDSVLGRYSIQPSGDTSLSRYGVERIANGKLAFYRALEVSPQR